MASDLSPPLDLLAETARSIIQDGVLWPEMSNFIEVTAQIELYRARAVEFGCNTIQMMANGNDGCMPGHQVQYALDDQRHKELRSRYLSMLMFVKRAIIVRRLRLKQVEEAEKAYAIYWPRDTPVQLTPFTLVITQMSLDERSDLAAEAVSIRSDMNEIQSWCVGHPSFTLEMFGARFPKLIDKKWTGVAVRWIDDVCNIIKEIFDSTQP